VGAVGADHETGGDGERDPVGVVPADPVAARDGLHRLRLELALDGAAQLGQPLGEDPLGGALGDRQGEPVAASDAVEHDPDQRPPGIGEAELVQHPALGDQPIGGAQLLQQLDGGGMHQCGPYSGVGRRPGR
jgi:hypothetical protein